MRTVGLTGGIGAGKSTVASMLEARGALVIDADVVARQVVMPGTPAHAALLERFGTVDRGELAAIVFDDPAALADLNSIVHPAVGAAVDELLASPATRARAVVVLEVPLLVEVGWDKGDVVLVVDCPEHVAVARVVAARGMSEDAVRRRMAAQATRDERLARADYVVENAGTLDDLAAEVAALWPKLAGGVVAGGS